MHAIAQARGRKESAQPARAYGSAAASEIAALVHVLARYPRGLVTDPPSPEHDPSAGPPIVLVPGYGLPWTAMAKVVDALEAKGLTNVHVLEPFSGLSSIEPLSEEVHDRLVEITDDAQSPAIAIGFGAGGLALRWAIDQGAGGRIGQVITVGTPHGGSRRARLGLGLLPFSRELSPSSSFLAELDPHPLVASTAIFSHLDTFVVPASSALWGDQAVAVPGVGHLGLLWDDRSTNVILAAVVAAIAEPIAERGVGEERSEG